MTDTIFGLHETAKIKEKNSKFKILVLIMAYFNGNDSKIWSIFLFFLPTRGGGETLLDDMDKGFLSESVLILEDNWSKITLAKNPVNHKRAKHIDIRYHFIRSIIEMGRTVLEYCPTADMVADVMTKPATKFKFEKIKKLHFWRLT